MTNNLVTMPARTFTAKQFESQWEIKLFRLSGTLDGFIDFAVPEAGTYPLSLDEAKSLISALSEAVADVQANCLYEHDVLLEKL